MRKTWGLRAKGLLIIATPTLVLAVLGSVFLSLREVRFVRQSMFDQTRSIAGIIAQDFERLDEHNRGQIIGEVSEHLGTSPLIERMWVTDATGDVLFTYTRPGLEALPLPAMAEDEQVINRTGLWITRPVEMADRADGRMYVQADSAPVYDLIVVRTSMATGLAVLAMLGCVGLGLLLQRLITGPIIELATVAQRVTADQDYSLRVTSRRRDELGQLADSFNAMMAQIQAAHERTTQLNAELEHRVQVRTSDLEQANEHLEQANARLHEQMREHQRLQHQVVEASRQAGMAEIATGVLHNVGNVLNSINVSASLLEDSLCDGKLHNVGRVADLLVQHQDDLPALFATERGRQMPGFLAELAKYLEGQRNRAIEELRRLIDRVGHVKRVISSQQAIARGKLIPEPVQMADVVEDALRIQLSSIQRSGVELVKLYDPVPPIVTDKHATLQILINLLSNACKALRNSESAAKRITVRLVNARSAGRHTVCVEVIDNGVGIDRDQLTRIFTFGYSGWEGGHGFGLHGAANTARQLQGELTAASDGPGCGARFRLELPVNHLIEEAAA